MPEKSPRIIRFKSRGIMCSVACGNDIKNTLNNNKKISPTEVLVDWQDESVIVKLNGNRTESDKQILSLIKEAMEASGHPFERPIPIWNYIIKGAVGTVFGLALLVMMACGLAIPMVAMFVIGGLSTLLTLYLGWDTYKSAILKLIHTKKFRTDALFTLSTLTALIVSIVSLFVPWLPMMFDMALMILGLKFLGVAIEEAAKKKIMKGVAFRDRIPRETKLVTNLTKKTEDLVIGDQIVIFKEGIIPVDCICLDEESYIYETIYNGSIEPKKIKKNDRILAGMRVANKVESMTLEVIKTETDSHLVRADRKLDEQKKKAQIENTIDKILRYFVPTVLVIAIIAGVILSCCFPLAIALQCVIAIFVSVCPCALGLIIPLAINVGMNKSPHVTFKGSEPLLAASQVDTIVFDYNGTLTKGVKTVERVEREDKTISKAAIYDYLYLLEENYINEHAVAKVIYNYAENKRRKHTDAVRSIQCSSIKKYNSGVRGEINGEWYTLGNYTLMLDHHVKMEKYEADTTDSQVIYLAKGDKVIAQIKIDDPLRDDALEVVNELPGEKFILTGSDRRTAEKAAKKLGIKSQNIRCDCVPFDDGRGKQTKTEVIQELQRQGLKVAFIGDGGNDTHALGECLGIAVKSHVSDAMAEDSAGVITQGPLLKPVMDTFNIAKQTLRNIKISLAISLACNITTLLLAGGILLAVGFAFPVIGVALMVVQACLILGVAYYYKRKSLPEITKHTVIPAPSLSSTTICFEEMPQLTARPPMAKQVVAANPSSIVCPEEAHVTGLGSPFILRRRP